MNRTQLIAVVSALVVLVGAVAVVVGVVQSQSDDTGQTSALRPTGEQAPEGLEEFYSQELTWDDCGEARCADVTVPVDYDDPSGDTTSVSTVYYAAEGDGTRALFVNPGGPGGSAVDYARVMATSFGDDVRSEYAVVGVDPRGVGRSNPIDCVSDEAFDTYTSGDPDPTTPEEIETFRETTETFGRGCVEKSGELAGHVSTEEAARDMDVVRAVIGQEQMNWFGASYGTQLGATYATLFPETVGAMVLDGAVDPAQDAFDSSRGQATGFQRALDAYIASCVKLESCPLGQDPDEAVQRLVDLLDGLEDEPLPTGSDRELTKGEAFYGVAVTLYDKSTWVVLSQALTAANRGSGAELLRLRDAYFSRAPDGSYPSNIGEVISAITCLDNADRPSVEDVEEQLPSFEEASPVFGPTLAWSAFGCTDWPLPAEHPQIEIDAAGADPIVVIGTTRDPATPYENARKLADQLGDGVGVLLTREGDGHTAYSSGNECIVDAVDTYLLDGTPPDDGFTCEE